MLALGLLLLTDFTAIGSPGSRAQQPSARQIASTLTSRMSCADIEDVPAGFVEGYKRHQAATYHAFTAEEVSRFQSGQQPGQDLHMYGISLYSQSSTHGRQPAEGTVRISNFEQSSQAPFTEHMHHHPVNNLYTNPSARRRGFACIIMGLYICHTRNSAPSTKQQPYVCFCLWVWAARVCFVHQSGIVHTALLCYCTTAVAYLLLLHLSPRQWFRI